MTFVLHLTNFCLFDWRSVAPKPGRNSALAQRSSPAAAGFSVTDPTRDQGTTNRRREHDCEVRVTISPQKGVRQISRVLLSDEVHRKRYVPYVITP